MSLIKSSVAEKNFPKFKAALLKLGYDENSDVFQKLVELWDDCLRASHHP
jgi:hypothetical protein